MASVLCRLGITVGYGTNHEVMVLGLFKNIVKCVLDPPKLVGRWEKLTSENIFQTSSLGWCIE
uniref:Uncharacterized protein n=1 Tax=Solanum tuberosum TaxID=4113 RepID=M1C934_SOLTU